MKTALLLLVLWEAPQSTDSGISMAEPVEAIPAAQCLALAAQHNLHAQTHWFCLAEGKEPNP